MTEVFDMGESLRRFVEQFGPFPERSPASFINGGYHHDHDEELGMYWYGDQSPTNVSAAQVSKAVPAFKHEAPPATRPSPSFQSSPTAPSPIDPSLKRLGERIRELRTTKEFTQAELASRCGLDRSFVSDLELGRVTPTYLQLRTLAETLRLSLASLIDFKTQ
jgi:DNA-binding XRE family transcriptional regulator